MIIDLLTRVRIVPVLTIRRRQDAVPLARALVAGGIDVLEITLRTEAARDAARDIIAQVPDAVVGLGTVLSAQDLADAEAMGARFAVSPGSTAALLAAPRRIPLLPGIATASDAMQALAAGHQAVKFFPAGAMGGIACGVFGLEALGGMGGVSFMSQLVGTVTGAAYALAAGAALYGVLKATVGIRLSEDGERMGADLAIHNITAYPEEDATRMG